MEKLGEINRLYKKKKQKKETKKDTKRLIERLGIQYKRTGRGFLVEKALSVGSVVSENYVASLFFGH
jgi:hypothetical protein